MSDRFDILRPELIWIGDICYRKMPIRQKQTRIEDDLYPMKNADENDEDSDGIPVKVENNEYSASLFVPSVFFGDAFRRRLMRETNTHIDRGQRTRQGESLSLTIKGANRKNVCDAFRRIKIMIDSARLKADFTHFISFPMNCYNLQRRFTDFKDEVLGNCFRSHGVTTDIFQNPRKLHITIATLVLCDNFDRETASSLLQECREAAINYLKGKPLKVKIKGIEYMNDDATEVDVLYAKVQDFEDNQGNFKLQVIADNILQKFEDAHLTSRPLGSRRPEPPFVKLHITLMNTISRNNSQTNMSDKKKRETFDATEIMKLYSDFDFGMATISEIHLSIRYATDIPTGYYKASSVIKL